MNFTTTSTINHVKTDIENSIVISNEKFSIKKKSFLENNPKSERSFQNKQSVLINVHRVSFAPTINNNENVKENSQIKIHRDYLNLFEEQEGNLECQKTGRTPRMLKSSNFNNFKPVQSKIDQFNMNLLSIGTPLNTVNHISSQSSGIRVSNTKTPNSNRSRKSSKKVRLKEIRNVVQTRTFV